VELSRSLGVGLVSSYAGMILGTTLIEHGDPEHGTELLINTGGGTALPDSPGGWRAWDLDRLTQGFVALGRRADAECAAADAETVAAAAGTRFAAALAGRARARVALAAGDATTAADRATASVLDAEAAGAVAEAALSRLLAGRALAAAGAADRAAEELERAARALDGCGAVRARDEAERELGKLGRRRHRRTRPGRLDGTGLETLTERELQIARLIVDRRTNAQIAEALFLSRKTVETHVRHLFEKLEVSSRVDVARAVERADRLARR
jgi:DNA-binding NarL/FixJ family response regulator